MNLPANFLNDIQGKDTSLIPLVVIEGKAHNVGDSEDYLESDMYFSTNNISTNVFSSESVSSQTLHVKNFQPLLLNIPSIKQSVDVENRRFKISSVTLSISNYEYEGKRFSDLLQEISMINWNTSIFWKSPTSTDVVPSKFNVFDDLATWGVNEDALCPMVYKGKIRKISHTTDIVTIELEDDTEKNHMDVPSVFIGDHDGILEKYRNKPIPMVYGKVDKSPIVIDGSEGGYTGVIDRRDIAGLYSETNEVFGDLPKLSVGKNETTLSVPETVEYIDMDYHSELAAQPTEGSKQWQFFQNKISFMPNLLSIAGFMQTISIFKPNNIQFRVNQSTSPDGYDIYGDTQEGAQGGGYGFDEDHDLYHNILDGVDTKAFTDNDYENIEYEGTPDIVFGGSGGGEGVELKITSKASLIIGINRDVGSKEQKHIITAINGIKLLDRSIVILPNGEPDDGLFDGGNNDEIALKGSVGGEEGLSMYHFAGVNSQGGGDEDENLENWWYELVSFNEDDTEFSNHNPDAPLQVNDIGFNTSGNADYVISTGAVFFQHLVNEMRIHLVHRLKMYGSNSHDYNNTVNVNIKEIDCMSYVDIESPFENNFYVSVEGRMYNDVLGFAVTNPADIILDIVTRELSDGGGGEIQFLIDNIDNNSAVLAIMQHYDLKFGFTVYDKQINSKKLIEDIAKSTLMFPHFGNDGKFRFNTIKKSYDSDDILNAILIPESEVLSFSFSKTKLEQVYTSHEIDYKYDYEQKSYSKKSNVLEIDIATEDGLNHMSHYGLKIGEQNTGKLESAYIRDDYTAEKVNGLLFNYYKNQHLILKLKLPVKYIGLAVGDVIKFEELLGGITAHGIDYTDSTDLFGQEVYPLFFITSLQKNIDSVSVELIQLHDIDYDVPLDDDNGGDIDEYIDNEDNDIEFTPEVREKDLVFGQFFTPTGTEGEWGMLTNPEEGADSQDGYLVVADPTITSGINAVYVHNFLQLFQWRWKRKVGDSVTDILNWSEFVSPNSLEVAHDVITFKAGQQGGTLEVFAKVRWRYGDDGWGSVLESNEEGVPIQPTPIYDYDTLDDGNPDTHPTIVEILIHNIDAGVTFIYDPHPWVGTMYVSDDVPTPDTPLLGDANQDGVLNILDIVIMVNVIFAGQNIELLLDTMDLNDDGMINILDVVGLVNLILAQG